MDSHDRYWNKFYPEFFEVYYPEQGVSNSFTINIDTILSTISKKYEFKNYGTVDAKTMTDWSIQLEPPRRQLPFPPQCKSCGLLSLDLHSSVGGGHWAAWIYLPTCRYLYVYDSMMITGNSIFMPSFRKILQLLFKNPTISSSVGATCRELKKVRLKSESRQPTGGFIYNEDTIMKSAITEDRLLDYQEYNRLLGYKSQHQYCFAEAVMFLEDVMKGKTNRRACKTGRVALIQIKRFIYDKIKDDYPTNAIANFLQIYNPDTYEIEEI
tara:strand:- start:9835 stop:10638 length:804 start_codon:yes stop_codon:yes gene_type:complete